jgi:AraC family ethanolamine operon transcriptional activator
MAAHSLQPLPSRAGTSRADAVRWVEAYLRAHIDEPVRLTTLCRLVGLSERGLRNAFYDVHGMSPKRWILAERLRCVHRALSGARERAATVTDIAADYGFFELGRFAAWYREVFGEAPSDTLRAAHRHSA